MLVDLDNDGDLDIVYESMDGSFFLSENGSSSNYQEPIDLPTTLVGLTLTDTYTGMDSMSMSNGGEDVWYFYSDSEFVAMHEDTDHSGMYPPSLTEGTYEWEVSGSTGYLTMNGSSVVSVSAVSYTHLRAHET